MNTPTKFLPVKMPKCSTCGDTGWKDVPPSYGTRFDPDQQAAHQNSVSPCLCDRGIERAEAFESVSEKQDRR